MANFTTSNCVGRHNSEDRRRNRISNYIHDSTHESTGMEHILLTSLTKKLSHYYRDIQVMIYRDNDSCTVLSLSSSEYVHMYILL